MTDFLEYIGTWSVLKWIVLVLIAGFIGQFGKMTAEAIVKKVRARRQQKESVPETLIQPSPPESSPSSPSVSSPDKKMLKAMAKAKKKEAKNKV